MRSDFSLKTTGLFRNNTIALQIQTFVVEFNTILRAFLRKGMLELYHLSYHQVKLGMMEDS